MVPFMKGTGSKTRRTARANLPMRTGMCIRAVGRMGRQAVMEFLLIIQVDVMRDIGRMI